MRMTQTCEQASLAREAQARGAIAAGATQHLDRCRRRMPPIAALREPDLARTTATKQALDAPGTEACPAEVAQRLRVGVARHRIDHRAEVQKLCALRLAIRGDQAQQTRVRVRIVGGESFEQQRALRLVRVHPLVERAQR